MSTLSAAALNKENAVAPRAQSGKTSTTTAPTAAARTFGANLTNQEKNAAKTALKGAALQPAKTPLGVSKRPSAVLDDVVRRLRRARCRAPLFNELFFLKILKLFRSRLWSTCRKRPHTNTSRSSTWTWM